MLYIQVKNGKPFEHPILHDNLLMLIPAGIIHSDRLPVPDDILSLGYTIYMTNPKPENSDPYSVVEEVDPVLDENNYAQQTWIVRPMSDEERTTRTLDLQWHVKKDRYYRINGTQWVIERHRDEKDLGIPTTLTQEEINQVLEYRQALRSLDYTDPLNVVWPDVPEIISGFNW